MTASSPTTLPALELTFTRGPETAPKGTTPLDRFDATLPADLFPDVAIIEANVQHGGRTVSIRLQAPGLTDEERLGAELTPYKASRVVTRTEARRALVLWENRMRERAEK